MTRQSPIHAVIGVRAFPDNGPTYYVKRSQKMTTYKGVWSLLSHKFDPYMEGAQPLKLSKAEILFEKMSKDRLGGIKIVPLRYLTSGSSDQNPMQTMVTLHLYDVVFRSEPDLNPRYYTQARWMSDEEYEIITAGETCGLCTRLLAQFKAGKAHGLNQCRQLPT